MRAHTRAESSAFFSACTRKLMSGGVAVLISRLGMRREVALYCELNAPLMSRRALRLTSARTMPRHARLGRSGHIHAHQAGLFRRRTRARKASHRHLRGKRGNPTGSSLSVQVCRDRVYVESVELEDLVSWCGMVVGWCDVWPSGVVNGTSRSPRQAAAWTRAAARP